MCKKIIVAVRAAMMLLFLLSMNSVHGQTKTQSVGSGGVPSSFANTNEIRNYFIQIHVDIEELTLKVGAKENFIFATYPFSGLDTIPVYWFVKFGNEWERKMIFYVLSPVSRRLTCREHGDRVSILCAGQELISLNLKPATKWSDHAFLKKHTNLKLSHTDVLRSPKW